MENAVRSGAAYVVLVVANILSVAGWGCQGLSQRRTATMRASSMEPTIENGAVVRYELLSEDNAGAVRRGEVVVVKPPLETKRNEWLKRVVALEGDVVEIREDRMFVNGEVVLAEYGRHPAERDPPNGEKYRSSPTGSTQAPVAVPAGTVFVIGDNWENSMDSRHFGPIPLESIVGIVELD